MRRFYFENENSIRIALNDETGIFLFAPTGLGVEFEHEYGDYAGNGFFRRNKFKTSQLEFNANLLFNPNKTNPYYKYRELLDWISSTKELYLVYAPSENGKEGEYYRRVHVKNIEKSELSPDGSLITPIVLLPLTPWFHPSPISIGFGEDYDEAMRYDFYYDDQLIYGTGDGNYHASIPAGGHMPGAILLTFKGTIVNPVVSLIGRKNGKVYGECSVTDTFSATDTFVLSTQEQDSYVKKIKKNSEEEDLIDKLDITKNAFFTIPQDEDCDLRISGGNINGEALVKVFRYYRGV